MNFLVNLVILIINIITSLVSAVLGALVSPQAKRTLWSFINMLISIKTVVVMLSMKGYQLLRRRS